jgi:hypothetical protein
MTVTTTQDLTELAPFAPFSRQCEKAGIATRTQLQWWLRYRKENGLSASGAIIEKRPNPRSKRPMLFVNKPRFAQWLSTDHAA